MGVERERAHGDSPRSDCVKLRALLAHRKPTTTNPHTNPHTNPEQTGTVAKFPATGNRTLSVYVASPPSKAAAATTAGAAAAATPAIAVAPRAAVILATDIYGFELPNTRLWADRLAAKTGLLVVVPDFFGGDWLTDATRSTIGEWRTRHPKARVLGDFDAAAEWVRATYPSVKRLGAVGFCWGGGYAVFVAGGPAPKVDAAVGYHVSSITPADVDAIAVPVSLQQSDPKLDNSVNATLFAYIEKSFASKRSAGAGGAGGLDLEARAFPGMPHGFALRGNMSDPEWLAASNAAFDNGAAFLAKHLLPAGAAAAAGGAPAAVVAPAAAVAAPAAAAAAAPAKAAAKPALVRADGTPLAAKP